MFRPKAALHLSEHFNLFVSFNQLLIARLFLIVGWALAQQDVA